MGSLSGRVAIVTGASRGLGREIAAALVDHGARVALLARPSRALDEAAARLGEATLACACDVRSPDEVRESVARAASHFGRLDILINNAAACLPNQVETASDGDVRAEVETNVMGPIWCVRAAIPHLRAAGGGEIVNVSSESVNAPVPWMTIYAATKAALEAFSDGLRTEVRDCGIRVTILRSGAMATSIVDQWSAVQKEAFFAAYAQSERQAATGGHIDPAVTADAIIGLLQLPGEANIRLVELTGR